MLQAKCRERPLGREMRELIPHRPTVCIHQILTGPIRTRI
jgi:hypothetical protein